MVTGKRERNRKVSWWFATSLAIFVLSCSEKEEPGPSGEDKKLVSAIAAGSRTAAELKFFVQLSGRDIDPGLFVYDVNIFNVVYVTRYKDEDIHASGLILLPETTTAVPMISFQHGTIVQQADAPSVQPKSSEAVVSYAALASMGFITVVPDFIGFGESKEFFHPYYVETPTADAVTDLLDAAVEHAENIGVDFNSRLFLGGYSQGGYATLAAHKAVESNSSDNFNLIASFPAAGGYDIKSMQEHLFAIDTYGDPYYLAYVGMSYQSHYNEPQLLSIFFKEPYASAIPALFDGVKSPTDINAALTEVIADLVTADALQNFETSPQFQFLREKFAENSLTDWTPVAPVFFYHGDADVTVPFSNSQITYDKLLQHGATAENLQLITVPGTHDTAFEPYIEDVIKKLEALR